MTQALGGTELFIKPCSLGSSVGINKAHHGEEYQRYVKEALRYDTKIVIEKGLKGREIECAVLGHHDPEAAFYLGEIKPHHAFYSYEAKYLDPEGAELVMPAALSVQQAQDIREMAVKVFGLLGCSGLARVDFFVCEDGVYLNEVNTLPGFTPISLYPKLWELSGLSPHDLIRRLLSLAEERFQEGQEIQTDACAYRSVALESCAV
jgi:D-alanine-D-alanine ligase